MGGWRNRCSRRKYDPQRYLYRDNADPFHGDFNTPDNVPSWEKRFCRLVGSVPWGKIIHSKMLLNYHDNILKWDDSAAEEAFQNAKKRFWAEMNGLPCGIPCPSPDAFIDEINWNETMNPELIKDIDLHYFNPDEVEEDGKLETKKRRTVDLVCSPSESNQCCSQNADKRQNPWESGNLPHREHAKSLWWSSSPYDDNINEPENSNSDDNPWERGYPQGSKMVTANSWGRQVNSSTWNQWEGKINHQNSENPVSNEKWSTTRHDKSGWDGGKTRNFGSSIGHGAYSCAQEDRFSKDRRWRAKVPSSQGQKPQYEHGNEQKGSEWWGVPHEGTCNRASFNQNISRYRNSGFQGGDYQTSHHWNRARVNKKVSYALQ